MKNVLMAAACTFIAGDAHAEVGYSKGSFAAKVEGEVVSVLSFQKLSQNNNSSLASTDQIATNQLRMNASLEYNLTGPWSVGFHGSIYDGSTADRSWDRGMDRKATYRYGRVSYNNAFLDFGRMKEVHAMPLNMEYNSNPAVSDILALHYALGSPREAGLNSAELASINNTNLMETFISNKAVRIGYETDSFIIAFRQNNNATKYKSLSAGIKNDRGFSYGGRISSAVGSSDGRFTPDGEASKTLQLGLGYKTDSLTVAANAFYSSRNIYELHRVNTPSYKGVNIQASYDVNDEFSLDFGAQAARANMSQVSGFDLDNINMKLEVGARYEPRPNLIYGVGLAYVKTPEYFSSAGWADDFQGSAVSASAGVKFSF